MFIILLGTQCTGEDKSIYRRGARRWRKVYLVNGHRYQAKRFARTALCKVCHDRIWGLGRQGYKCLECKIMVHKRCHKYINLQCADILQQQQISYNNSWLNNTTTNTTTTTTTNNNNNNTYSSSSSSPSPLHKASLIEELKNNHKLKQQQQQKQTSPTLITKKNTLDKNTKKFSNQTIALINETKLKQSV